MTSENERQLVARFLEAKAQMVREGLIQGFKYEWKGAGEVVGTDMIVPAKPIEFISLTFDLDTRNECSIEAGGEVMPDTAQRPGAVGVKGPGSPKAFK